MKKYLNYLSVFLIINVLFILNVEAASFSVRASSTSVTVGNTVTVTVAVTGASGWEYCINYNADVFTLTDAPTDTGGKCVRTGSTLIGYSSVKFKFKANKSGSGTFSLSGAAAYDDDGNSLTSSVGSTTITARTQSEIQATYSSNADLKSLSVEGYTLSPEFNKNETNYTLEVPNDVESVVISAVKDESHAQVSGGGTIELAEGLNKVVITVTAQKGNVKKYNIDITRKELNPINVSVDGKNYSVVRKKELLIAPNLFVDSTTMINDEEVICFRNETTDLVLVGLKDEEGNIGLYIYDGNNYVPFKEYATEAVTLIPYEPDNKVKGFDLDKEIEIGSIKVKAYYQKDSDNLVLVYGMNLKNGEKAWYTYDVKDGTLQKYYENSTLSNSTLGKDTYFILAIVFGCGLAVSFLLVIILLLVNKKIKNKNKKLISLIESKNVKKENNNILEEKNEKKEELKESAKNDVNTEEQATQEEEIENDVLEKEDKVEEIEIPKEAKKQDEKDVTEVDSVSAMEKEIINNIATANDKDFEETTTELDFNNDETMTNDIIDDVTLESSIIRTESNVLSKKDIKRLAKEQKKLREQAQKEFLDDKTFVTSAFDKYVREETEVLPVIDDEQDDKKINKKRKKKEK